MTSGILVAGAGHGGLVAAMHLARAGHNVLVVEQREREGLGWDWQDHVPLNAFERAGLRPPSPDTFFHAANLTFTSPDLHTTMVTNLAENEREIVLERKCIIDLLVHMAERAGASFIFGAQIDGPLIEDDIVVGVSCEDGRDIHASMVIDAAGLHSPVRQHLPRGYGIQHHVTGEEVFHAYRAYHRATGDPGPPTFTTHFGFNRLRGISWYQVHEDRSFVDILVGKMRPFAPGELQATLEQLKQVHPAIGDRVLRGGRVEEIPVRRQLDRFTGDNYAAVGDSACMAKPINGSGVEHAMIAGNILAATIDEASRGEDPDPVKYSQAALWSYQRDYVLNVGASMAGVEVMKDYLATAPWDHLNFLFEKHILTARDVEAATRGGEINVSPVDMLRRMLRGWSKPRVLLALKRAVSGSKHATRVSKSIPDTWDQGAFNAWCHRVQAQYKKVFR